MITNALFVACCTLTAMYFLLMLLYRYGWKRTTADSVPADYQPTVSISVIVPARNEADNLPACLSSLLAQRYPAHLFEVIVVDDHSEDDTAEIALAVGDPRVQCIRLADYVEPGEKIVAFKKKALATGIAKSVGALIVTTDADCVASSDWLLHLAYCYEQRLPAMIIAPVDFTSDGRPVELFQSIDFMSMQGITAAAHQLHLGSMSNGANLAFSRAAYDAVNGYSGTEYLASGDDLMLTAKMQQAFPHQIYYLKSQGAIVRTGPQRNWSEFLQQRIRWASKSGKYNDPRLTGILVVVYLFNFSFLPALWLGISQAFYGLPLMMILIKILGELIFLVPVTRFFGKSKQLWWFPLLQPLHILYIIAAGFLGFIGIYKWKGRQVKNVPTHS